MIPISRVVRGFWRLVPFRQWLFGQGPLLVVALLGLSGCARQDDRPSPGRQTLGDTTVVRELGHDTPYLVVDEMRVVWRSDSLAFPSEVARVGGRIVVADRDRLHWLTAAGDYERSVGRSGEGPGEFSSIAGLDARDDTLFVYDRGLRRMSYVDATGEFLGSTQETPHPEHSGIDGRPRVRVHDRGYVYPAYPGVVSTTDDMSGGIVWHELGGDSTDVIGPFFWNRFIEVGDLLVEPEPFRPSIVAAAGPEGAWAVGLPGDYCIDVGSWQTVRIDRLCRDWGAAPVTAAVRDPDYAAVGDELGWDQAQIDGFTEAKSAQDWGDEFPAYDLLWFGENGDLWVRTFDADRAVRPPFLEFWGIEPDRYRWDRWAPEGELLATYGFPSAFEPRLFLASEVWGFLTMPVGDLALARAPLPPPP